MNKSKKFVYFPVNKDPSIISNEKTEDQEEEKISQELLQDLLKSIEREILKEMTPSLGELEQTLQENIIRKKKEKYNQENNFRRKLDKFPKDISHKDIKSNQTIIATLMKKGYLKDSEKWLSNKGFVNIGGKILHDVMKELKKGDFGIHQSKNFGYGSIVLESTKKYEIGDDIRLINVSNTLLNSIL
ncbi:MAG TPA: hypothetical protein VFV86_10945, partial [Nitrososphaeraceae archaeon]|nr:hypothetical protein [Nitrososphaeraceae archaeon]